MVRKEVELKHLDVDNPPKPHPPTILPQGRMAVQLWDCNKIQATNLGEFTCTCNSVAIKTDHKTDCSPNFLAICIYTASSGES